MYIIPPQDWLDRGDEAAPIRWATGARAEPGREKGLGRREGKEGGGRGGGGGRRQRDTEGGGGGPGGPRGCGKLGPGHWCVLETDPSFNGPQVALQVAYFHVSHFLRLAGGL